MAFGIHWSCRNTRTPCQSNLVDLQHVGKVCVHIVLSSLENMLFENVWNIHIVIDFIKKMLNTCFCLDTRYEYNYFDGPLTRYVKLRVAHARECREHFPPPHLFQRKRLVSDPDMHHGTCVTHVPWCMSGSLTRSGGENVPGIPGACATRNFTYLVRGPLKYQFYKVTLRQCFKRPIKHRNLYKELHNSDGRTIKKTTI